MLNPAAACRLAKLANVATALYIRHKNFDKNTMFLVARSRKVHFYGSLSELRYAQSLVGSWFSLAVAFKNQSHK